MNDTAYRRARKAITPHSNRVDYRKYESKYQSKEGIQLLKLAAKTLNDTGDLEQAAKVLNVKVKTFTSYASASSKDTYKYLSKAYQKFKKAKGYDPSEHGRKANAASRAGARKHRESCAKAGLDYKSYFGYLKQTCFDKTSTSREIKGLNESIGYLQDKEGSENELKVLREKVRLAKQFFRSQRY
tara:strand:- start:1211 stop:1765 length:555 start_codon:yes stop_codon:yes gene_type:complete